MCATDNVAFGVMTSDATHVLQHYDDDVHVKWRFVQDRVLLVEGRSAPGQIWSRSRPSPSMRDFSHLALLAPVCAVRVDASVC